MSIHTLFHRPYERPSLSWPYVFLRTLFTPSDWRSQEDHFPLLAGSMRERPTPPKAFRIAALRKVPLGQRQLLLGLATFQCRNAQAARQQACRKGFPGFPTWFPTNQNMICLLVCFRDAGEVPSKAWRSILGKATHIAHWFSSVVLPTKTKKRKMAHQAKQSHASQPRFYPFTSAILSSKIWPANPTGIPSQHSPCQECPVQCLLSR